MRLRAAGGAACWTGSGGAGIAAGTARPRSAAGVATGACACGTAPVAVHGPASASARRGDRGRRAHRRRRRRRHGRWRRPQAERRVGAVGREQHHRDEHHDAAGGAPRGAGRDAPPAARRPRSSRRRRARRPWRSPRRAATAPARAAATGGRPRRPPPSPRRAPGRSRSPARWPRSQLALAASSSTSSWRIASSGSASLAQRRGGGHGAERGAPQPVAQVDPGARDQLGDRVAVHAHDLGDLVIGQALDLAQRERLALAHRQALVGGADLLLVGLEQRVVLGALGIAAARADGHGRLGDVAGRRGAAAARDRVVARVASRRQHVGGEVQVAVGQPGQPLEHLQERLLRRVGGVVARAGDPVAEVVGAALVAVVEGGEGGAVAGRGAAREAEVVVLADERLGGPSRSAAGNEKGGRGGAHAPLTREHAGITRAGGTWPFGESATAP